MCLPKNWWFCQIFGSHLRKSPQWLQICQFNGLKWPLEMLSKMGCTHHVCMPSMQACLWWSEAPGAVEMHQCGFESHFTEYSHRGGDQRSVLAFRFRCSRSLVSDVWQTSTLGYVLWSCAQLSPNIQLHSILKRSFKTAPSKHMSKRPRTDLADECFNIICPLLILFWMQLMTASHEIKKHPGLNAYITKTSDTALAQAKLAHQNYFVWLHAESSWSRVQWKKLKSIPAQPLIH